MSVNGMNHRTLMGDNSGIAYPKSMGIYDRHLYFIDSRYDHLVRVNADDGSNMEKIIENDPDLKSLTVFSKKTSKFLDNMNKLLILTNNNVLDMNHPCAVTINGGCQQLCIPSENGNRVCACSVGYKKELDIKCTPHTSFAVVSQVDLVRGFSLTDTLDAIVPISGPGKY